ncbi:putative membrane protein [Kingella oralis ATCC 51147]|uniref:Membrane protein n=2 Tax=Kingella TaxID=32257 RepID=C4GKD4_9NEIS|nr:putative membrane protein [Kingella oralis ATCC 51147]
MGAYAVAFWRLAVAAVIFALLMRFFAQKLPKNPRAVGFALLSGVFLAFDLALWHESIYAVGPGISTLLNCLQIFWLSMMGVLWFQEKLGRRQIASFALALVGIAVIGSPEFGHNSHALWGFVSGIASGLMLSLSMVFIRKTHQAEPTALFALMLLVSIGGMAALVAPALTLNASNALPTTAAQIGWLLVYGAAMQCFAWGLIAYCIPLLSLGVTGLLLLTEPVAALFIDFAFLGKPISALQWLGAAITLLAIYLGSLKTEKAA